MTRDEINKLIEKWGGSFSPQDYRNYFGDTQYDDRSAMINYCMIREHKPKVIVEFGSRKGRCTRDIYQALRDNGGEFDFRSFELEDNMREQAQASMDREFGNVITIGGDVVNAKLPTNIDYLFLDHYHDEVMNNWVFDKLLPEHCADGCIVAIHDIPIYGDYEFKGNPWDETALIVKKHQEGTLPLEKIYWTYEEDYTWESTWWKYRS